MSQSSSKRLLLLGAIGAIVAAVIAVFALVSGRFGRHPDARSIVDGMEAAGKPHPGYRRNHAKGICVSGSFSPAPGAAALSTARAFSQPKVPVVGRFSISGGDPLAPDGKARVRGLGLLLRTDDGQQWRLALGNFPFFPVSNPEGFVAQGQASRPDPKTGKPDPQKMKAFLEQHPEVKNFLKWAGTAPWPTSLANTRFNGINAFLLTNPAGQEQAVRWSLQPETPFEALSPEQLQQADRDFLAEDLAQRLSHGALSWDMVLQFADAGDPLLDPSKAWPEERRKATVGTLTLDHAEAQETGNCRDINFDPLILPQGVAGTADPVLQARSAAYAVSFNRREVEISRGKASAAIGKEGGSQ